MERIKKLEEYLIKSPGDSFLKHALALEYIKLGDDDKAEQQFRQILSHDATYIGSYYHLGKLLKRKGEQQAAKFTYEQGMQEAKKASDQHSYNELQAAFQNLS